jgi:hypothetical protein
MRGLAIAAAAGASFAGAVRLWTTGMEPARVPATPPRPSFHSTPLTLGRPATVVAVPASPHAPEAVSHGISLSPTHVGGESGLGLRLGSTVTTGFEPRSRVTRVEPTKLAALPRLPPSKRHSLPKRHSPTKPSSPSKPVTPRKPTRPPTPVPPTAPVPVPTPPNPQPPTNQPVEPPTMPPGTTAAGPAPTTTPTQTPLDVPTAPDTDQTAGGTPSGPVVSPPTTMPPPVQTRPGNGWGDANHIHTGPPGHDDPPGNSKHP